MDPTKKPGVDSGAPEELAVSASCGTPVSMRKGQHQSNRSICIWETGFIRPSKLNGTYYGIQMCVRPS